MISGLKPYSLILIAVMPNPRDLNIARLLGWYRIPLRSAPKVVDVDFLAFYQPGVFPPPEGGRINYLAKVMGHELTTRGDLFKDDCPPERRNEEYYKVQIGSLEQLDNPIESGSWKRITFLYTTGEYLLNARTIADVVVHSEERATLWQSLRERQRDTSGLYTTTEQEIRLDPQVAAWLGYFLHSTETQGPGGNNGALD
jgi:hypothetical protein